MRKTYLSPETDVVEADLSGSLCNLSGDVDSNSLVNEGKVDMAKSRDASDALVEELW